MLRVATGEEVVEVLVEALKEAPSRPLPTIIGIFLKPSVYFARDMNDALANLTSPKRWPNSTLENAPRDTMMVS